MDHMLDDVFFAPADRMHEDRIQLDEEERRHLVTVTRHGVGDEITIVDGLGAVYTARVDRIQKKTVECQVLSRTSQQHGPHIEIGVGLLRNPSRFDLLVEKATELGVSSIVPLATERVHIHRTKSDHWNKIALSAMKQSGRAFLPTIAALTPFEEFVHSTPSSALALIPHERDNHPSLSHVLAAHGNEDIRICIGPEGGFTGKEVDQAVQAGFHAVSLGNYRLRAETAAIAALTLCVSHHEEIQE